MGVSIGIDIGGTFTDVVLLNHATGELSITKVSSTPPDFNEGFWRGVDKIQELTSTSPADIERLIHGTTVATNAIIEHSGGKIGILTTEGFQDVLHIGRTFRSEMYNVFYEPETPIFLCPRHRIMEIKERIDGWNGDVLVQLEKDNVLEAVDALVRQHNVDAVAVCYLFSHINPVHEKLTEQIIRQHYPKIKVSISSSVNPKLREYERLVITAFDAYVGPNMETYIRRLKDKMHQRQIGAKLQVMQSRGSITSADLCIEKPVVTLLSGLAGGVAGGSFIGSLCGARNLITLDMGGTSNDVALIRNGKPYLSTESKIGKYPIRQTMIDITTIGAGGSTIAWVDEAGVLKVGPKSSGADPGPACYGLGGMKPTVTDASVVLGYLNPEYFAGGELRLTPKLANEAIQNYIAKTLNINVTEAASGIHRIINNNMADQIRLVSVYKGYHPRDFSLIAFGGAGSMFAGRLMQLLEFKEVIIPISPGVLSAFGLLVANIDHEEVASFTKPCDDVNPEDIMRVFHQLEKRCEQKRQVVGMNKSKLSINRIAEMRYVGQSYELDVLFPEGENKITNDIIQDMVEGFHRAHQEIYHHSAPNNPVEFVSIRTVYWQEPKPTPSLCQLGDGDEAIPKLERKAYFDENMDFVKTPVFERAMLTPGQKLNGPAIVEQTDTTTVIYPNQKAIVDKWGNLVLSNI